jgi:hypothetical protein
MPYQKGHPVYKGCKKGWFKKGCKPKFHFKKGHIPWNKGTKGIMKVNKGSFKKNITSWNKGKHLSKKHKENLRKSKIGKRSNHWKGGKFKQGQYTMILSPNHPFANKRGYILRHRLVMERHLGRYLKPEEVVHHIDGNPSNDRIKNLMLFPNQIAHQKYHLKLKKSA